MSFYITDEAMGELGGAAIESCLERLGPQGPARDKFALTPLPHDKPLSRSPALAGPPRGFGFHAGQPFYPCSVVKAFYLVAAQARLAEGFIRPHEELDRAMRDMILVSSNTATNYVIDLVTGTTGDT